jgi:hypothetical protein
VVGKQPPVDVLGCSEQGGEEDQRSIVINIDQLTPKVVSEPEIVRVTREWGIVSLWETDAIRAVYHLDFRFGQHDLIGHNQIHNEIIAVWESIGGRFLHQITDQGPRQTIRLKEHVHRRLYTE